MLPAVPLLAANWKMYKGPRETQEFCAAFQPPDGVEAVLCPPFVSLAAAVESGHTVFAQNVHWADEGAFTGEVSARMLREVGVAGAIVGHSERRQYFDETDETVARRTVAALNYGLRVIACVGESEEERESGQMELVLRLQVEALDDAAGAHEGLVIAYEPVWAIGTGEVATPQDAQEVCSAIRDRLRETAGSDAADRCRILYGGSVKAANIAGIMAEDDVDGALVGGASLQAEEFGGICRFYDMPVL
jgi:triosephosphate isomerase (TIM)